MHFLYSYQKYIYPTIAVNAHALAYTRYSDSSVLMLAKIVQTQIILNTTLPMITIIVGITLFPSPLAPAAGLSMNAEMKYEQLIIASLIPP